LGDSIDLTCKECDGFTVGGGVLNIGVEVATTVFISVKVTFFVDIGVTVANPARVSRLGISVAFEGRESTTSDDIEHPVPRRRIQIDKM
jgi:hypothetical protein